MQAADYFNGSSFVPGEMAEALIEDNALKLAYRNGTVDGCIMEYDGGVWKPAHNLDVQIQDKLGKCCRDYHVQQTLSFLKRRLYADGKEWEEWNPRRRLINCRNDMLDPETGELMQHEPSYLSLFQLPVEWNPDVECSVVDNFLQDVVRKEDVPVLKQMMGYLLVPVLKADKFFVLEGKSGTGKTTFWEAFLEVIGSSNYAQVSLQDITSSRFGASDLENKLVGTYDDLRMDSLQEAGELKKLTGGFPYMRIERKYEQAYEAPLFARFLFTCNRMPEAPDKSEAWYRRLCLIPFPNQFYGTEAEDPEFADKLQTPEAKQRLFYLAVEGLQNLMANDWRFPVTDSTKALMRKYRLRNDSLGAFVEDHCNFEPETAIRRSECYDQYEAYCDNHGASKMQYKEFKERMAQEYDCTSERKRIDGELARWFIGVDLETSPV